MKILDLTEEKKWHCETCGCELHPLDNICYRWCDPECCENQPEDAPRFSADAFIKEFSRVIELDAERTRRRSLELDLIQEEIGKILKG